MFSVCFDHEFVKPVCLPTGSKKAKKSKKSKKNEKNQRRQKFRILNDREMASGKSDQAELSR